ncbi:MAG TPA: preprotein translocase subunit SecG [bacterium]|jgi:preprotein translocase subunit SecG|nr:preprotein translocase subunit SecG [Myxococcales bacterium]OQA62163.1 MAG: Protein-export membrane protein SecG [bacterium ADurb.Bin270]HPM41338.1 preprotein translocase subunit SecG [bacterium]HPW45719.1 preprotein translocase subunit SecG [bacterium]HQG12765.1 preprotein translocase subunit SecG [bacterium]
METLLLVVHYLLCFFLIVIILLQAGKGADIGALFGGASQTVFGGRGPTTFLNRVTVGVAIGFLVTSISLAHIAKNRSGTSVLESVTTSETGVVPKVDNPLMDLEKEGKEAASESGQK